MPELDWNGPRDRPFRRMPPGFAERGVFEVFGEVAARWAERPAIRCVAGVTSYGALMERARGIGAGLGALAGRGGVVGLALPVDRRFPAGMLGALGAGWMYVPLDLSQPGERLAHIMAHAGMGCVLACDETRSRVEGLLPKGCRVLDVDAMQGAASGWRATGNAGDAAYLLYTSGTTGRPKGVYQDQRGLMHDVMQYTNSVHFSEQDVTSLLYSPGGNGAIRDIYGALLNGGCLCMVDLRRDGFGGAAARMAEAGITLFHAMPPVLRSLLREVRDPAMMARVRLAYVAGDRLWGSDVRLLRGVLPRGSHLYTGIGSTECATLFRQWFVPGDWPVGDGVMPVGHAVPDRDVRILGEDGVEVGCGEAGIITVRGRTLARGYWRDEAGTALVFRREEEDAGRVTFWTGDRGRLRPDGLLEFLGRGDRQVKVRGYRVELVEVEAVMRGVAGVEEAGVVSIGEGDGATLVGFVQGLGDGEEAVGVVTTALAERLPASMRPAWVVGMRALPRLGNGKPDLNALRAMAESHWATRTSRGAGVPAVDGPPAGVTPVDDCVMREWTRVLGVPGAGMDDVWTEAGGDSLRALECTVAIERELGVRLGMDVWLGTVTPRTLALRVREAVASVGNDGGATGPGPVPWDFYVVPWAPGASSHDRALADALGARFRVEILGLTTLEQECDRVHSIADLARRCVGQVLGRTRPGTPIGLMGLSFGGRVAVELAAQLRAQGHTIAFLCVGDIAAASGYGPLSRRAWRAWAESAEVSGRWGRAWRRLQALVRGRAGLPIRWMARMGWQGLLRGTTRLALAVMGDSFRGGILAAIRQSQIPGWVIPRHEGELVLMVTDDTASVLGGEDPTFGWRAHAGSVRVVRAEGNHNDYFSGKHGPGFRRQVLALAVEAFGRLEGRP